MDETETGVGWAAVGESEVGGDFFEGAGCFSAAGDGGEAGGLGDGGVIGIVPEDNALFAAALVECAGCFTLASVDHGISPPLLYSVMSCATRGCSGLMARLRFQNSTASARLRSSRRELLRY